MKTVNTLFILFILLHGSDGYGQDFRNSKETKGFQLSILPLIGTDGSSVTYNSYRLSVNIPAGVTGGIEGLEAGALLNITNGSVKGVQLSGFGNAVSKDVQGFQAAGFFNAVSGDVNAMMGAGFINITGGSFRGASGAGFININGGSYNGFAGAGFMNISGGSFNGFSGAGFANIRGGETKGFTGAGFANITGGGMEGMAGAGFANITGGDAKGAQFAGFINISRNTKGIQASGFINVTGQLQGMQIGVINLSDTVSDGFPLGLINIVRKGGLKQVELATSYTSHMTVSVRLGLPVFYNIFSYSLMPFYSESFKGFGYGVGTGTSLSEKTSIEVELHTTRLHENRSSWRDKLDLLSEARLNISYKATYRLSLFGGPVLYNQYYRENPDTGVSGRDIAPSWVFGEREKNGYASRWWPGARAGVRITLF